ncbi:hypothetical protein [Streptomyces sp. NPDC018693]|uniref:hypothetical protein n=1 Tax=unclassified Streptomyces TaxID=2593676 RepID=UPI0037A7E3F1
MAGLDGLDTVTISGRILQPQGTAWSGAYLTFAAPTIVTTSGTRVLGGTTRVDLSSTGIFSVELLATDATGIDPTGWTYEVKAYLSGVQATWTRYLSLPKASPAVDFGDIVVADPVSGSFSTLVSLEGVTPADIGATAGPASSTDNTVPRFDGTTGKVLQTSTVVIADDGSVTILGAVVINGADLSVLGTGKGYRFRRGGDALDVEATGVDLLISNWSDDAFGGNGGTQRSYFRLSADAQNIQAAGKIESVAALYGAAVHTLDPTTGVASLGGKNGLTALRLAGFKATSGAPDTGTWEAGDVVLDSAGGWHLCTVGGEPGTWT